MPLAIFFDDDKLLDSKVAGRIEQVALELIRFTEALREDMGASAF